MKTKNQDLHGSVPEASPIALLLIDVINAMEFEGGEDFARRAEPAARRIAELKRRAKEAGIPVIYANDNFGRWQSDFRRVVEHCLNDDVPGEAIARLLEPEEDDYFVLKPKHSAFFATSLDTLLSYLGANTLILTGFAGNICILFTANDAYMRDYRLLVPADCVSSARDDDNAHALAQIADILKADVTDATQLELAKEIAKAREAGAAARSASRHDGPRDDSRGAKGCSSARAS